jgi:hypothetical protein
LLQPSSRKIIQALQVRNRELVKQRNEISTSTAEGRAKIALLNQEIDKNNTTIRTNVSQLEKQKINIGNYASALDGVIPGLGGFVQGTQAMTTASRTFIATPIGAIIGAIGLALGALIAYFKGSEEGQNRLNRIMNIGGAIMEKVMDVVEGFGGALFEAFTNPKKAITDLVDLIKDNLVNRFKAFAVIIEGIKKLDFKQIADGTIQLTTGIENGTNKIKELGKEIEKQSKDAADRADRLSKLQESINKKERDLTVQRAKTARDVAKIVIEAQDLEGEARIKKMDEAIALEKNLLETEKSLAADKLALANMVAEDDPTIENKQAQADAVANFFKAEESYHTGIRRLNAQRVAAEEELKKAREKGDEEETKKKLENLERLKAAEAGLREVKLQQAIDNATTSEERVNAEIELENFRRDTLLENTELLASEREFIIAESEARIADIKKKAADETAKNEKSANEKSLAANKSITEARINLTSQIGNAIGQLAGKNKALAITAILIEKAAAIAQIISNTAIANLKAIATSPLTFGQPWVGINTATGIVAGIGVAASAASSISQIGGFAEGGLTGTRINERHGTPINRANGDNLLATVRKGEVILNERQQAALGGPRTFQAIGVPGFAEGGFTGLTQTNIAHRSSMQAAEIERVVASVMRSFPPIVTTIEDINAGQQRVNQIVERSTVI